MNESMEGRAEVTTRGIKMHKEQPHTQGRLERSEIIEAIRKLIIGKAPGLDGIAADGEIWKGNSCRLDDMDMQPSVGAK